MVAATGGVAIGAPANWMARLSGAPCYAALIVIPGFVNLWSSAPFEPSRALIIAAFGAVMMLLSGALVRPTWMVAGMAGVLLSYVVSGVAGVNPVWSMFGSPWRGEGVVALAGALGFGLAASTFDRRQTHKTLEAMAYGSVVVVVVGLLQRVGFDPVLAALALIRHAPIPLGAHVVQLRPYATLGNPEFVGSYLAIVVPVTAWLGWQHSWRWYVLLAGQVVTMVVIGDRSAVLAVGVAVAVTLWRVRPARDGKTYRGLAYAILFAGALLFSGMVIARGGYTLTERALVARETPAMIAARPILGSGPETFALVYPQDTRFDVGEGGHVLDAVQNLEIDTLVQRGIVGLIATLALWAGALVGAWRWDTNIGRPVLAGLIAAFLDAQFAVETTSVLMLTWVLFGLVAGYQARTIRRNTHG